VGSKQGVAASKSVWRIGGVRAPADGNGSALTYGDIPTSRELLPSRFGDGWKDNAGCTILFVAVLLAIGLTAWHWEIAIALFCVFLIITDANGESLVDSQPQHGSMTTAEGRALRFLLYSSLAVLAIFICLRNPDRLGWWWIGLALPLLALRQVPAQESADFLGRLVTGLRKNLFELFAIAGIVLSLASIVLWRYESIPLSSTTIGQLRTLERRIEYVHQTVEARVPAIEALVALSTLILIMRVLCVFEPALERRVRAVGILISTVMRWAGRLSTAFALAAAITFLATESEGSVTQVAMTLRDALREYNVLQADLTQAVDPLARENLLQRAWVERPDELVRDMPLADGFYELRNEYEREYENFLGTDAHDEEIKRGVPTPFETIEMPPAPIPTTYDSFEDLQSSWTLDKLSGAAREISQQISAGRRNSEPPRPNVSDNVVPDLIAELFVRVDFLKTDPGIESLKSHYPVIGEFLAAIGQAAVAAGYGGIRDRIARQVGSACIAQGCKDLSTQIISEARAQLAHIAFVWSSFDVTWHDDISVKLTRYKAALSSALDDLEPRARERRREALAGAKVALEQKVGDLENISNAPDFVRLRDRALLARKTAISLAQLGTTWPGRNAPTLAQKERLKDLDSVAASLSPSSFGGDALSAPEEVMKRLEDACESIILRAVDASRGKPQENSLSAALGAEEYSNYMWILDAPVREKANEDAARIKQRQDTYIQQQAEAEQVARQRSLKWAEMPK